MDTKTKIRLRQRDLDRVNALKLDPTIEDHLIEQLGEQPINRVHKATTAPHAPPNRSTSRNTVQFNDTDEWDEDEEDEKRDSDTRGMIVLKPEMWVSKYFEAREHDHETNSKMHPTNVKSKLPNQKIISSIRPVTANPSGRFYQQLARSKSSMLSKPSQLATPQAPLVPILFNRPKTPVVRARPKTAVDNMRQSENKLMTGSQLNLMTYSEVDDLVNSIVQSKSFNTEYERAKEERNKEMYKRLWLLKSKGEYHGSLLAQTRSVAPEIRE